MRAVDVAHHPVPLFFLHAPHLIHLALLFTREVECAVSAHWPVVSELHIHVVLLFLVNVLFQIPRLSHLWGERAFR